MCAQCHVEALGQEELGLGREVDLLCPVVLLVGQSRTIKQSSLKYYRRLTLELISQRCTHIAHITHLLGYERAVGEVLLMGRAVGIDSEWHTKLSYGEVEIIHGSETRIGIEHLDVALIGEVKLSLVAHSIHHLSQDTDAGVAHLKSAFALLGLVFILGPHRSV